MWIIRDLNEEEKTEDKSCNKYQRKKWSKVTTANEEILLESDKSETEEMVYKEQK